MDSRNFLEQLLFLVNRAVIVYHKYGLVHGLLDRKDDEFIVTVTSLSKAITDYSKITFTEHDVKSICGRDIFLNNF